MALVFSYMDDYDFGLFFCSSYCSRPVFAVVEAIDRTVSTVVGVQTFSQNYRVILHDNFFN